jgi:hypothetical protein
LSRRRIFIVPSFWYIIWFPGKTNVFGATVIRCVFSTIDIHVDVVGYGPVANFLGFVAILWIILVLTGRYLPIGIAPMDHNRHPDKRQGSDDWFSARFNAEGANHSSFSLSGILQTREMIVACRRLLRLLLVSAMSIEDRCCVIVYGIFLRALVT